MESEFFVNTGVLHVSGELNRTIRDMHNASTVMSDSWSCVAFEQEQVRVHGLNKFNGLLLTYTGGGYVARLIQRLMCHDACLTGSCTRA